MRHIVLLVCSHTPHLEGRQRTLRAAGYWPLPAPTMTRALALARKVRPALVLSDVDLSDGHAVTLLRALRTIPFLEQVPIIVLGVLAPEEHQQVAHDPYVEVHPIDENDDTLVSLVDVALSGQRPADTTVPTPTDALLPPRL